MSQSTNLLLPIVRKMPLAALMERHAAPIIALGVGGSYTIGDGLGALRYLKPQGISL